MSLPPGTFGATDPLFLLLLALAVEAYIGDRLSFPRALPHPRRLLGKLLGALEQRLNRFDRPEEVLRIRGVIFAAGLGVAALAAGVGLALVTRYYPFAWVLEALILMTLVSQRGSWRRLGAVREALDSGSLVTAREALGALAERRIPAEELEKLQGPEIAGAAIAALGDRFAARLVAPVFWYILLGLPGLFVQQCIEIAAARSGRNRSPSGHDDFAGPVVTLDRWIDLLPDRVAGLLLAAAAAILARDRSLAAFRRLRGSAAWPRAALTAGLGLVAEQRTQAAIPGPALLSETLRLFAGACLLNAALVAFVLLLRVSF